MRQRTGCHRPRRPREFRANINVYARRQRRRIVERADANEEQLLNTAVDAPDRYPAEGAAIDRLWAAAGSRHWDRLGIAG